MTDYSSEIPTADEAEAIIEPDDITTGAGFIARSRKAFVAAVGAGAAAAVPALTAALGDGVFDWAAEFWPVATPALGFAVVAFLATWSIPNAD